MAGLISGGASGGGGASLSDNSPAAPGTASAGVGTAASRDDHVHAPLIRKVVTFFITNAAASATTSGNRQSGLTDYPYYVPARACQVTAVSVRCSGNPAGSTAIIRMEKNAGAPETSLDLNVTAGATRSFSVTGSGVSLAANDVLRAVVVCDGSWTGTTVDFCVDVELTETA